MKNKYVHHGVKSLPVINRYIECFGPGTKAELLKVPEDQINLVCSICKNVTCSRSGRGRTGWDTRMANQVEFLLNNPIFSDLATNFHKEILSLEFQNTKQKVEQITIDSKTQGHSGWEQAEIKPDSSILGPIPNLTISPRSSSQKEFQEISSLPLAPQDFENRVQQAIQKSKENNQKTISSKKYQPKIPRTNSPQPSGGIMIGGDPPPSSNFLTGDPWVDADKVVNPGAVIKVKG